DMRRNAFNLPFRGPFPWDNLSLTMSAWASGAARRRRAFIPFLGAAIIGSVGARAQQSDAVRRIGVLMNRAADDPQGQARLAVFQQRLQQLGWTDGGNVRIDTRWGADDVEGERKSAAELVALKPDIVLASGTLSV